MYNGVEYLAYNLTPSIPQGAGLFAIFNTQTDTLTEFVRAGGETLAHIESDGRDQFVAAENAVPPTETNAASGDILWRKAYKPYGESLNEPMDASTLDYTGHIRDDSGLVYMQARYYDPEIGRFLSNDPLDSRAHIGNGNIQGFNRYNYAYNNPYKFTDPTGLCPEDADKNECFVVGPINGSPTDTVKMDEAASVAAPDLRVRKGSVEDAAIIKADGSVSRDGVTPYEYGAKYSAKALNEAEAVIHSHPDHSAKELAGPGDGAMPLKAGKANYVVFKDKLGVTEIEGGQLQFRMVEGKISNGTQRRYIRNALKRQLKEHNKEAK